MEIGITNITFSSAHFLPAHGKCGYLHGHNYRVEIAISGKTDKKGMVRDFTETKKIVRDIVEALDHKLLIAGKSEFYTVSSKNNYLEIKFNDSSKKYLIPKEDCHVLPMKAVTCEFLAGFLFKKISEKIHNLHYVKLWETDNSWAIFHK